MTKKYLLFAVLLGIATWMLPSACSKSSEEPVDVVVTIPPEFIVDLYEQRDTANGEPVFGLWIESVANYPASGYALKSKVERDGNNIALRLLEVSPPNILQGQPAPARTFIPIGDLPPGNYQLSLWVGTAIENKGTLEWNQGVYEWKIQQTAGIDLQNRVLYRIPEGTLWGHVSTADNAPTQQADAFLTELKSISSPSSLQPGYYGYFTINGAGLPFFHRSWESSNSNAQSFVRSYLGNQPDIHQLLNSYRASPNLPLDIKCLSTEGAL